MENQASPDDPQLGILVHQLPQDCIRKILEFLPEGRSNFLADEMGLKVFFSSADRATECILKKNIKIDGILYNIYPLVTWLSVCDIQKSISEKMIKKCLKDSKLVFPVIFVDHVDSSFRLLLDVPEVLANFQPPSILLTNLNFKVPMQFYCRICRKEGHKQYQCSREGGAIPGGSENLKSTTTSDKGSLIPKIEKKDSGGALENKENNENKDCREIPQQNRGREEEYPCKEVQGIILKTSGILQTEELLEFLKTVYRKKDPISLAKKFTSHIPALVYQIERVIQHYYTRSSVTKGTLSDRDIKTLENLCVRLQASENKQD